TAPQDLPPGDPPDKGRKQAPSCQSRLHDASPPIARRKFSRSYFDAAFHSGWMFNEADVDGGSCEQAAAEHSNEFSNLARRLVSRGRLWHARSTPRVKT